MKLCFRLVKLELLNVRSQAGAWERVKTGQFIPGQLLHLSESDVSTGSAELNDGNVRVSIRRSAVATRGFLRQRQSEPSRLH